MKYKSLLLMAVTTLSLLMMGPVYATSPQKSTIITINGDDVGKPRVCNGDIKCELRNAQINFIYAHGSQRVVVLDDGDVAAACEAGSKAGISLTVIAPSAEHTCP